MTLLVSSTPWEINYSRYLTTPHVFFFFSHCRWPCRPCFDNRGLKLVSRNAEKHVRELPLPGQTEKQGEKRDKKNKCFAVSNSTRPHSPSINTNHCFALLATLRLLSFLSEATNFIVFFNADQVRCSVDCVSFFLTFLFSFVFDRLSLYINCMCLLRRGQFVVLLCAPVCVLVLFLLS